MKKIYQLALAGTIGLLSAACTDDDMSGNNAGNQAAIALQPATDVVYGRNVMVFDADTLSSTRIALNTDQPVSTVSRDGKILAECVNEGGRYSLRVMLNDNSLDESVVDRITLTSTDGTNTQTKDLYVSVRRNFQTRAVTHDDNALRDRFAGIFAAAVPGWILPGTNKDNGTVQYNALDKQLIAPHINIIENVIPEDVSHTVEGSTLEEYSKKVSASVGFGGIPLGSLIASLSVTGSTESKSRHYYEYMTVSRNTREAVGSLPLDFISSTDSIVKYISKELAPLLDDQVYGNYTLDEEGTCNMIEDFGSHIATYCELGTQLRLNFTKKSDMQSTANSIEASFKAKAKFDEQTLKNMVDTDAGSQNNSLGDKLKAYEMIYGQTPSKEGSISGGVSWSELNEETEATTELVMIGGNRDSVPTGKFEQWIPTDDPTRWMPISYTKAYGTNATLIPLYNLCINKNTKRYALLRKLIDTEEGYKIFCKYKNVKPATECSETEWVIAGLCCKVMGNSDDVKPFKAKCIDSKERTFYPMAYRRDVNEYSDYAGKVLDTQKGEFGKCGRGKQHVWFYALAMRDDCPGISDIRISEKAPSSDYYNEMLPCNATFSTGWSASVRDTRLWVKPIAEGDTKTRPITAFALNDDTGRTIGSTGGSEYGDNMKSRQRYNDIWESAAGRPFITQQNDDVYFIHLIYQPNYIHTKYSTKPLLLPVDKDKYAICHPTDMGK